MNLKMWELVEHISSSPVLIIYLIFFFFLNSYPSVFTKKRWMNWKPFVWYKTCPALHLFPQYSSRENKLKLNSLIFFLFQILLNFKFINELKYKYIFKF